MKIVLSYLFHILHLPVFIIWCIWYIRKNRNVIIDFNVHRIRDDIDIFLDDLKITWKIVFIIISFGFYTPK